MGARQGSLEAENQVYLVKLPSGQDITTIYNADNRRVQKLTQFRLGEEIGEPSAHD